MVKLILQCQGMDIETTTKEIVPFSKLIQEMLSDDGDDEQQQTPIPLPGMTPTTMQKILEWCRYHTAEAHHASEKITQWDQQFIDELFENKNVFFDVLIGAKYLDIDALLHLTCFKIVTMIKEKSPEEIRKTFSDDPSHVPSDEEMLQFVQTHQWMFGMRSESQV